MPVKTAQPRHRPRSPAPRPPGEAVGALKVLANQERMLLLCQLSQGEMCVGDLGGAARHPRSPRCRSNWRSCATKAWWTPAAKARTSSTRVADPSCSRYRGALPPLLPRERDMTIEWNQFTPWSALAGGALIGLAAAMFVLLNGRIAGISGILGGLLNPVRGDVGWRVAFVRRAGRRAARLCAGATLPRPPIDASLGALVAAGLLVGVGTRYGSGCTSGHGVCGLVAPVAAVAGRDRRVHGRGFRHGLRDAPRVRRLRSHA